MDLENILHKAFINFLVENKVFLKIQILDFSIPVIVEFEGKIF